MSTPTWAPPMGGLPGTRWAGIHLRPPGHGSAGPTVELFPYEPVLNRAGGGVNRPGFGHVAFEVDDVEHAVAHVPAAGGSRIGETVMHFVSETTEVTFAYVTDPEGNALELPLRS